MNVYDEAHTLAKAIKESEEFKHFNDTKRRMDANAELASMMKDFQNKQLEIQTKQLSGEEVSPDVMASIQNMYQIVMRDPLAAEHMQNEMRLSMMMSDIYKIIAEAIS